LSTNLLTDYNKLNIKNKMPSLNSTALEVGPRGMGSGLAMTYYGEIWVIHGSASSVEYPDCSVTVTALQWCHFERSEKS